MAKSWKEYSKREGREIWRARFQFKNKTYRIWAYTKEELDKIIREIKSAESKKAINDKYGTSLDVPEHTPTLEELFDKVVRSVRTRKTRVFKKRVFKAFLTLMPAEMKITDLTTDDYQEYINHRRSQVAKESERPISHTTISKEVSQVSAAINDRMTHFLRNSSLKAWTPPETPKARKGLQRKAQRTRVVSDSELEAMLIALRRDPRGSQNWNSHFHRVRLAHTLEFGFWTGLRRKEIAALKFSQFDPRQDALLNVERFKTGDVASIYPISKRAVEIIESRRKLQKGSPYIFTANGKPVESSYRTLKNICGKLGIAYGKFTDGGFVVHDLRRNFGTEMMKRGGIETARVMLGHADISQTQTYLSTNVDEMRAAIRKRDRISYDDELNLIFVEVKSGQMPMHEFAVRVKKLFGES